MYFIGFELKKFKFFASSMSDVLSYREELFSVRLDVKGRLVFLITTAPPPWGQPSSYWPEPLFEKLIIQV